VKLIDILVQELPKHGGWPVGVKTIEMHMDGDIFFDGDHSPDSFCLPQCDDGWRSGLGEYSNEVTREQYESALAASQPQWNGEGLPPAGTECEFFDCEKWFKVTMMYGGSHLVVLFDHDNQIERSFSTSRIDGKLRPIRSEAELKREEAVAKLIHYFFITPPKDIPGEFDWESMFAVYDAIAAGKIPHIQLK